MGQTEELDLTITVTSTVPIARGMGSGAAVSTAIVRGLGKHCAHWFSSQAISDLVYETERIYHGTPSGIDNTVVSFEKPVYFVRDKIREVFWLGESFLLAIADTGIESRTKDVVGDLQRRLEASPDRYRPLCEGIGEIVINARVALEQGETRTIGRLMNENHTLLQEMGVSCQELDRLVLAARDGGALGAKLSGAGWGGNMIALITERTRGRVDMMLRLAGATRIIVTEIR
jgi:mevalonate kinase